MAYKVEVTEPAENNIDEVIDWISDESPDSAQLWIDSPEAAIQSLEHFPVRCSLAPENDEHLEDIRQLLYGNYRVLFVVRQSTVLVLHVRHAARDRARTEDIY